jgi:hypothetical protein
MIVINWPKIEKFLSPDEIVDVLFERMKDAEGVKEFCDTDPLVYHHTLGRDVRNEFYLWHPENPWTMKDYVPQIEKGYDENPKHADNTCGDILRKLWTKTRKHYGYEN